MSEEGIKTLLGTLEEPESEEYEELNIDPEDLAFERYDFIEVLNSINTPDFKSVYKVFTTTKYPIETRRNMAREILEKINQIYDIEFNLSYDAIESDVDDVFRFLEFLEYDYIGFIADVWKFMNVNLRSDIRDFCIRNSDTIIKVIEGQIETHYLSPLISTFLGTYNKDELISMFIKMTENSRILIIMKNEEENILK